jgi:hypothetical protein
VGMSEWEALDSRPSDNRQPYHNYIDAYLCLA